MKKILLIIAVLLTVYCDAQIKISDLPAYLSNSDSALVPVVINGVNRKVYGKDLVKGRMDSVVSALSTYVQKQTQNPTATLTGGATVELMSTGSSLPYTLNWSAGRVAATTSSLATANISTINAAGTNETFSNPSAGSTVSGTQAVTVVRNTNTTFTNTVTTVDGKTATATTSVLFQPKRYWFYSTSATPTSSDVVAALGGGSELSTVVSKPEGVSVIIPNISPMHVCYAAPSSEGHVTEIVVGGFPSILSFPESTVSVTNASGYVQNYNARCSTNTYSNQTFTINSIQ